MSILEHLALQLQKSANIYRNFGIYQILNYHNADEYPHSVCINCVTNSTIKRVIAISKRNVL